MKALIFGGSGQLGIALSDTAPSTIQIVVLQRSAVNIVDQGAVLEVCRKHQPDVIVNAASYTAVDRAESEPKVAHAVNVDGARHVANAARIIDSRVIHVSTDFVFDGQASKPYRPEALAQPISVYGSTKRAGEIAMLDQLPDSAVILRTAWLYSRSGNNFVKTMLRLMNERDEVRVVNDQRGTPTWTVSLAVTIWRFAERPDLSGYFHWTDGGEATWYSFATAIHDDAWSRGVLTKKCIIRPIKTEDYPTAARRPRYSILDCSSTCRTLGIQQVPWRTNLRTMLEELSR